jgi:predicted secreted hydrolase
VSRCAAVAIALLCTLSAAAASPAAAATTDFARVRPGMQIELPRDHGAHPDYRTEWWYATGWLETASGETLGFQVTFFRTRPPQQSDNPSAFTARQLIIAHAAISDPGRGRLWKDQRLARAALGLAGASTTDTEAWLDDWRFERRGDRYLARIDSDEFGFELELAITQPPLLQGERGYSRKGPDPESASFYYSQPQLAVRGAIRRGDRRDTVTGTGWLDHEWSSALLDAEAVGWDWIGLNLDDGGALMLFRIRDKAGRTRWAGGSWRDRSGQRREFSATEVEFIPGRRWRSPRTGVTYPVTFQIRAPGFDLELQPLLDDQESDTRSSTGAIYWEGAVTALRDGRRLGRGYLELTGYGEVLRLP